MTAQPYTSGYADAYDLVYDLRNKDYAGEAALVHKFVEARNPRARSLLDVACGTGRHLAHLAEWFGQVEGVDLSAEMRAHARRRVSGAAVHDGDMRTLDLGRTFDVVTCLFASIAYLRTTDELRAAISRMVAHLNPGGVIAVEPWFTPTTFPTRAVDFTAGTVDDLDIARMVHRRVEGRVSHWSMHTIIGGPAGIEHLAEDHELLLFTHEEYTDAFTAAGAAVTTEDGWPARPLYVGVRS